VLVNSSKSETLIAFSVDSLYSQRNALVANALSLVFGNVLNKPLEFIQLDSPRQNLALCGLWCVAQSERIISSVLTSESLEADDLGDLCAEVEQELNALSVSEVETAYRGMIKDVVMADVMHAEARQS
jgi:hypothetical protein